MLDGQNLRPKWMGTRIKVTKLPLLVAARNGTPKMVFHPYLRLQDSFKFFLSQPPRTLPLCV